MKKLTDKNNDVFFIVVDIGPKPEGWIIPPGAFYIDDINAIRESVTDSPEYWSVRKNYHMITDSTRPFHNNNNFRDVCEVNLIPIEQVYELIGEVDVEKKAREYLGTFGTDQEYQGFKHGYNQCLEDNKEKKYTEEDMVLAFQTGYNSGAELDKYAPKCSSDFVKTLFPKTEWEVERINGKLKLVK